MDHNPTEQEIARRAYAIWEQEGRPHGRNLDHWLKAERELNGQTSPTMSPRRTESTKRGAGSVAPAKTVAKTKPRARSAKSTSTDLH